MVHLQMRKMSKQQKKTNCKLQQQGYNDEIKTFNTSRAIVRVPLKVLSVTEILSTSTIKKSAVEQGMFLKKD